MAEDQGDKTPHFDTVWHKLLWKFSREPVRFGFYVLGALAAVLAHFGIGFEPSEEFWTRTLEYIGYAVGWIFFTEYARSKVTPMAKLPVRVQNEIKAGVWK